MARRLREQATPDLPRKLVDGRLAVAKVVAQAGARPPGHRAEAPHQPPGVGGQRRRRGGLRAEGHRLRGRRQRARHGRGRAVPGDDVPLGEELLVGQHDGVAGDPEIGRELPRRGQARVGRQASRADRRLQRVVHAPVERTVRAAQIEEQHLAP